MLLSLFSMPPVCIASILVICMYVRTIPVYQQMHIWLLCLVDIVKVQIWFVFHTAALSLLLMITFPLHPPMQLMTKHLSPTTCTRRYIHHHIYQGRVLFSHRLWKISELCSVVYFCTTQCRVFYTLFNVIVIKNVLCAHILIPEWEHAPLVYICSVRRYDTGVIVIAGGAYNAWIRRQAFAEKSIEYSY